MNALDLIRAAEGLRLAAYWDGDGKIAMPGDVPNGHLTIGYGHTGSEVIPGYAITQGEADALLIDDEAKARAQARADVWPDVFDALNNARQDAIVDMAFTMGGKGLSGFRQMLAALEVSNWLEAQAQCLASEWARVQAPRRASRNARMLLTGQYPASPLP